MTPMLWERQNLFSKAPLVPSSWRDSLAEAEGGERERLKAGKPRCPVQEPRRTGVDCSFDGQVTSRGE